MFLPGQNRSGERVHQLGEEQAQDRTAATFGESPGLSQGWGGGADSSALGAEGTALALGLGTA
jgi:hypothetical protein